MLTPRAATKVSRSRLVSSRWTIAALAMSLSVAFGVGVLTGRAVQPDPPVGLAPEPVVARIDENVEAVNAESGGRLRATYARDAVLSDMTTGERWFGAIEIVRYISSMPDMSAADERCDLRRRLRHVCLPLPGRRTRGFGRPGAQDREGIHRPPMGDVRRTRRLVRGRPPGQAPDWPYPAQPGDVRTVPKGPRDSKIGVGCEPGSGPGGLLQ